LPPETDGFERLEPGVRSFLLESQRRVIEHCRRLLAAEDLAAEHRHRLTRLAGNVEADLPYLAG
jgi:hypothetical protein